MMNMAQQPLVNDQKCEQIVLSILLSAEQLYADTAEILSPEMFYNPKHALVYKAISQVFAQGESPDIISVWKWLAQHEPKSGIDETTLAAAAQSGVDIISVGALTHSVKALDISMDIGVIK